MVICYRHCLQRLPSALLDEKSCVRATLSVGYEVLSLPLRIARRVHLEITTVKVRALIGVVRAHDRPPSDSALAELSSPLNALARTARELRSTLRAAAPTLARRSSAMASNVEVRCTISSCSSRGGRAIVNLWRSKIEIRW